MKTILFLIATIFTSNTSLVQCQMGTFVAFSSETQESKEKTDDRGNSGKKDLLVSREDKNPDQNLIEIDPVCGLPSMKRDAMLEKIQRIAMSVRYDQPLNG